MDDPDIDSKISRWSDEYGIPKNRFIHMPTSIEYIELFSTQRTNFIKDFARFVYESNIDGQVAECGVFLGNTAKFINKYFYNRTCYLFDSFEGFSDKDIDKENKIGEKAFIESRFNQDRILFSNTSVDYVMRKMSNPCNVVVKQGWVPETFGGVEEKFIFVNLDMDLYAPTVEALKFFWRRMEKGGCILLHDYFHPSLPGIKKAVNDFEEEIHGVVPKFPIGDGCSIALLK